MQGLDYDLGEGEKISCTLLSKEVRRLHSITYSCAIDV